MPSKRIRTASGCHVAMPGADREHLLIEQRRRRPVRAAVLLRQRDARAAPGRAPPAQARRRCARSRRPAAKRRATPSPSGSRGRRDRCGHRGQPRASASAPALRSAGRTRPATTRLASTSKPVAAQATSNPPVALPQPDDGGIVEPDRPFDERREVLAVGSVRSQMPRSGLLIEASAADTLAGWVKAVAAAAL